MKFAMNKLNMAMINLQVAVNDMKERMKDDRGDFVLDHGIVFVIILVLGGIVLLALKAYFDGEFPDLIKSKIDAFFN